jgi:hypothetical protein
VSPQQALVLLVQKLTEAGIPSEFDEKSPHSRSLYLWVSAPRGIENLRVSDHELPALREQGRLPYWQVLTTDWRGKELSEEDFLEQIEGLIDWLNQPFAYVPPEKRK